MTLRQKNKNLYWMWKSIKQRCNNPKCDAYKNYGARGVYVYDEWNKFEPFLEWCLSNGYQKGLEIDRINNDGGYTPSNCRFVTRIENQRNKRTNVYLDVDGRFGTIQYHADETGISHATITRWIQKHGVDYAAKRLADAYINGYTPNDYGFSHRKKVRHESGREFESVRECAKYYNMAPCTISNAIRSGRKTSKGLFEYL